MRLVRLVAISLAVFLALAATAAAVSTERYVVGGDQDAQGWSRALQIVMVSPAEYEYDRGGQGQNTGGWRGPRYWATGLPTLGGDATIDWFVDVVRGTDAQTVARGAFIQRWPEVESGAEPIERFIGGRQIAIVDAPWILTKAPSDTNDLAGYEGALAFSLCGRWAVAKFATLNPSGDSAGSFGEYRVKGTTRASTWNRAKLLESFAGVRLEGNLPAARLTAARRSRNVAGRATDCQGVAVAATRVTLERRVGRRWVRVRAGTTSANGSYSLRAPRAGVYRAVVGARRSAPVRVG